MRATYSHKALDLTESFPKSFNGVGGGPQGCNTGLVGFQLGMSDEAIGTMQMGEHVGHRNIGKSKGVVIESNQVDAVNGSE